MMRFRWRGRVQRLVGADGCQRDGYFVAERAGFNPSALIFRNNVLASMPNSLAAAARLPSLRRNASRTISFSIAASVIPDGKPERDRKSTLIP